MNKIKLLLLLLFILSSYFLPQAIASKKDTINYSFTYFKSDNMNVKISLNGIPVEDNGTSNSFNWPLRNLIINTCLKKGKNILEIEAAKLPNQKESRMDSFHLAIQYRSPFDNKLKDLVKIDEPKYGAIPQSYKFPFPFKKRLEFILKDFPATYMNTNTKIILNDDAKKEIWNLIITYAKAMENNDYDAEWNLCSFKIKDSYKTLPYEAPTLSELKKERERMLSEYKIKAFKFKSINFDDLQFRLIGNSKIVWVANKDLSPPLTFTNKEGRIEYPIYVGIVDGKWTLVR